MKIQLDRLIQCPKSILDKIEIFVSDNCSTDNTEEIVKSYIDKGLECTYNKNPRNLGMDGNFVTCFKKAKGKYVWLLGDDDSIIIDSLRDIVARLSCDRDYGLVHIYNKIDKFSQEHYLEYSDDDKFARTISYYTTLISANIVQTKYVQRIDFERYMGTWFTLMPLYLTALINEPWNLLVNFQVFEKPKDSKRNGGYNIFEVFVKNYLNIWSEFCLNDFFNKETYSYIKKDIFKDILSEAVFIYLIRKSGNKNFNTEKAWEYLFRYYGNEKYFYITIIQLTIQRGYNKLRRYVCNK